MVLSLVASMSQKPDGSKRRYYPSQGWPFFIQSTFTETISWVATTFWNLLAVSFLRNTTAKLVGVKVFL